MLQMIRRTAVLAVTALAAFGAAAQGPSAASQAPLRLIVPFTPGTGIDLIARTIGPRLGERLGRSVVVDNRAGASGNIGTEAVVRAKPDGQTLLVSVNTLVMNRSLYPNLPFDPVKDLVPVSLTSWGQLLLVVNPKSGFHTAADLIRAAKARPGRLNYASPGVGTPHHLSMELFKATNGVFLTHIPYRGSAGATIWQAVVPQSARTVRKNVFVQHEVRDRHRRSSCRRGSISQQGHRTYLVNGKVIYQRTVLAPCLGANAGRRLGRNNSSASG